MYGGHLSPARCAGLSYLCPSDNFPNPFNPITTITYLLPVKQRHLFLPAQNKCRLAGQPENDIIMLKQVTCFDNRMLALSITKNLISKNEHPEPWGCPLLIICLEKIIKTFDSVNKLQQRPRGNENFINQ